MMEGVVRGCDGRRGEEEWDRRKELYRELLWEEKEEEEESKEEEKEDKEETE